MPHFAASFPRRVAVAYAISENRWVAEEPAQEACRVENHNPQRSASTPSYSVD